MSSTLRIMEPANQDIESLPRTRFTSTQRLCSASTTQSGMKRPHAETASVPLVSIDATARRVKKLRFVSVEEWFREPQDDRAGRDFYTLLQEAFLRAYEARGIQLSRHNVLDFRKLSVATGGARIEPHFTYLRGLPIYFPGQADIWHVGLEFSTPQYGLTRIEISFSSCSGAGLVVFPGKK